MPSFWAISRFFEKRFRFSSLACFHFSGLHIGLTFVGDSPTVPSFNGFPATTIEIMQSNSARSDVVVSLVYWLGAYFAIQTM